MDTVLGVLSNIDSNWLTSFSGEVNSMDSAFYTVRSFSTTVLTPTTITPIKGIEELYMLQYEVFAGLFLVGTVLGALMDSFYCPGFKMVPSDSAEKTK